MARSHCTAVYTAVARSYCGPRRAVPAQGGWGDAGRDRLPRPPTWECGACRRCVRVMLHKLLSSSTTAQRAVNCRGLGGAAVGPAAYRPI